MAGRRILIIGSQCAVDRPLNFLPELAHRLHELMTTGPSGFAGIPLDGRPDGLLIDPTVAETKAAIEAAIRVAATAGEPLVIAYLGHGDFKKSEFYLLPTDAPSRPTMQDAVHLASCIASSLDQYPKFLGLTLLIDACHAGIGVGQAMESWTKVLDEGLTGFELLTATDHKETADAPLFRTLIDMLERGDPDAGVRLTCRDVDRRLKAAHHPAQWVVFKVEADLGRNPARDPGDAFWKDADGRPLILQRTLYFQPTAALRRLVEASQADPIVVATGPAGVGKSTLASSLVRPELTAGMVPEGFVQALGILTAQTTEVALARDLETQLKRSVPGFAEAVQKFYLAVTIEERKRLDHISLKVLRPLAYLPEDSAVRIVLDGYDQISDVFRATLRPLLEAQLDRLRLVLTAHPETPECPPGRRLPLKWTDETDLDAYLTARRVLAAARRAILAKAQGQWLVTSLLADAVLAEPNLDLAHLPDTVAEAYTKRLDQTTGGTSAAWRDRFGPVLAALAVAGPGPILPLALLVHASATLEGPTEGVSVRAVLDSLGGLVVRSGVGTPAEHAGLFHGTFGEYLLSEPAADAGFPIDVQATHRAMVTAIDALVPSTERLIDDPLHRYAFDREAHHLWAVDEIDQACYRLQNRKANDPRLNLARCKNWLAVLRKSLAEEDLRVLFFRSEVASYLGEAGDLRGALAAVTALLPDQERNLGRGHHLTLATRNNIAGWTGECGDPRGALAAFTALLPDQEKWLGRGHLLTLATRNSIASWTGQCGDARGALAAAMGLLPDIQRELGPDHREVLRTRAAIAIWMGECGDAAGALTASTALLADMERAYDPEHPDLLRTRGTVAGFTGRCGNASGALAAYEALLPAMERALGAHHRDVLAIRSNIAAFTGECGDARGALAAFTALLPDQELELGRDHRDVMRTRNHIAGWRGRSGDPHGALADFTALLPGMERELGPNHPDVLRTRNHVAEFTGECGDERGALAAYMALVIDMERELGPDHPETLIALTSQGVWAARAGDPSAGCRTIREACARSQKRFGSETGPTREIRAALDRLACGQG